MNNTRITVSQSWPPLLPDSISADPPQIYDGVTSNRTFQWAQADVNASVSPAATGNNTRPAGVERAMRSRLAPFLAVAVSTVAMFGCGTATASKGVDRPTTTAVNSPATTTSSSAGNSASERVVKVAEWTNTDVLSLKVGESVVLLTPPVPDLRPDGTAVRWGEPHTQTDSALLRFGSTSDCAGGAACTTVVALSTGTTTIEVFGPSGILCPKPASGGGCTGVASIRRELSVAVTAAS